MKNNLGKFFSLALLFLIMTTQAQAESNLDALYTDSIGTLRAPASNPPEDLASDFVVTGPERAPSSISGKTKKIAHTPARPLQRRSRLPASVVNGFELRVKYNKLTSMFWVVERDSHYDLVFANSAGSKASLSLTGENFKTMYDFTKTFKATEGDLSKCKESSMQLHVVGTGSPERTVTTCVGTKTPTAQKLRDLSQNLAALVR